MKTPSFLLVATLLGASALVPALHAAEPAPPGVNALAASPDLQPGQTVGVAGMVARVSAERRMLTLVDASERDCATACSPKVIVVEVADSSVPLPVAGATIRVQGKIAAVSPSLRIADASFEADR